MAPALAELAATTWDHGNEHFPPTTWQISSVHAGTGALNVVPGETVVDFFRFSTRSTPESLRQRVESVLHRHGLEFKIDWNVGAAPFPYPPGAIGQVLIRAIRAETGVQRQRCPPPAAPAMAGSSRCTTRSSSSARSIATIHRVDGMRRCVADLKPLTAIYRALEGAAPMTLIDAIERMAALDSAGVSFGHGTTGNTRSTGRPGWRCGSWACPGMAWPTMNSASSPGRRAGRAGRTAPAASSCA